MTPAVKSRAVSSTSGETSSRSNHSKSLSSPLSTYMSHAKAVFISKTSILRLPLEVRQIIWQYYLNSKLSSTSTLDSPLIHRLCGMHKNTAEEIAQVAMRTAVCTINSHKCIPAFHKRFSEVSRRHEQIRRIHFTRFHQYCGPYHPSRNPVSNFQFDFATACPGLRAITMTFCYSELFVHFQERPRSRHYFLAIPVEELVEKYGLRQLLKCDMLHTLGWNKIGWNDKTLDVLRDLGTWAKDEFARKSSRQEVNCIVTSTDSFGKTVMMNKTMNGWEEA